MIYCGLIGGWAAQIFFQSLKKRFMMQMHKRDVFSKTNQPNNRKATGPNSLIYLKKTHTTLSKKKPSSWSCVPPRRYFCSSVTLE